MSWEKLIKSFKSYLQIECSLSINSVTAYIRDVRKLASYASPIKKNALQITRLDISDFLVDLNKKKTFCAFTS